MNNVQILVLDFGSQYTQLIARRLREVGVYTEIVPYFESIESIRARNPKGIILSGGPASVYEEGAYKPDDAIFTLGIPILGICYGLHIIAHYFGGKVIKADAQEFGKAVLEFLNLEQQLTFSEFNHQKFPAMLNALIDLWEDSVRSSHEFLVESAIAEIKEEVSKRLQSAENILVATASDDFVGFIGFENNKIDMLFVSPKFFKRGVGKALIREAYERKLKQYESIQLDCNADNTQGLAFYKYLGFCESGRSAKDSKGRNLPIVHFEVKSKNLAQHLESHRLFHDVKQNSVVWMSHADKVESIPQGFKEIAKSGNTHYCAIADLKRKIYALQFHPEVVHSECGGQILRNFAVEICGSDTSWNMRNFAENEIAQLRAIVGIESALMLMTFQEACEDIQKEQIIEKLLQIWEDSVKATSEISQMLIARRREVVRDDYLKKAEHILIAYDNTKWLGFIALVQNEITLLFVEPKSFKRGIGKSLIKEAVKRYLSGFEIINVNSCEWALEFYYHLGFKKTGAKPIFPYDSGKFKLIPLSIPCADLQKSLGLGVGEVLENRRCAWATDKNEQLRKLYEDYHDTEWGVPLHEDRKLFEFLVLETMQAGLSWITILKKREAFRAVFDDFDPKVIAHYDEAKIQELMNNESIIRNHIKIESAIHNAKLFLEIQKEFGSFDKYIWGFVEGKPIINHFASVSEIPAKTPLSDKISKDLQKRGFKFVGSTIMYAYMQAIGMVNDHLLSCPCRADSKKPESKDSTKDSKSEGFLGDFSGFGARGEGSYLKGNDQAPSEQSAKSTKKPTTSKVLCAVSGGVDSSVVAALLYRAIGENLIPVFVDTGLLRKGEREAVEKMFRENLKVPLITADASELFLGRLKGIIDPEIKRKIIGETFIEVFEKEAKKYNQKGEIKFLAQGTLYPDVIESVSVKGPSKTIKSHHNVGGLPEWMQFELVEPLRELFKDEVRALGRELGMPESMLMRHPFPGPGLAIRIMGEVNKRDLDLLREADSIFIEELHKQGYYDKVWQAFCVLLNVRSVGVMGDNRTYDNTICVRAVEAIDGMTATFAHLPHDFLESVSNRIINEVQGINRVVYDITSKPPGTIEWE